MPDNASPTEPVVLIEGLHLTLDSVAGPVNILRGLDLTVGRGETVSIVGPSGSGKTSLMMVIAGIERQTAGRVVVAGDDLSGLDEDGLALLRRASIGIVFQSFHLVPTMTALENVAIPLELAGRDDAFDRAREALASVSLDHRLTHYPGQLSGGEQQRVAVARAFVAGPELLLADEPTGNLDGTTGEAVMELLFDLSARHNTTLILITHDTALSARCSRRIDLADGRIVNETGTATALPS
jgi:putative ABC transport system ATP-binding protein